MSDSARRPVISLESMHQQSMYESDPNPLRAWKVYKICRQSHHLDIPSWVLEYLDKVADSLFDPPKDADPRDFAESALQIRTAHDFTTFKKTERENQIADRVAELIMLEEMENERKGIKRKVKLVNKFDQVAIEYSVSNSTVRKYYKERKLVLDKLGDIMKDNMI